MIIMINIKLLFLPETEDHSMTITISYKLNFQLCF